MLQVMRPLLVSRAEATTRRDMETPMAGWVAGYRDTARAEALHVRANSASSALNSGAIGSIVGVGWDIPPPDSIGTWPYTEPPHAICRCHREKKGRALPCAGRHRGLR